VRWFEKRISRPPLWVVSAALSEAEIVVAVPELDSDR
jgi:hypothetical protein